MNKFIIEVRDENGKLDFKKEMEIRRIHPVLFNRHEYTLDELCHYASFGQGRNQPTGPLDLSKFFNPIGIFYRPKTW
jgi:hypothetical protein